MTKQQVRINELNQILKLLNADRKRTAADGEMGKCAGLGRAVRIVAERKKQLREEAQTV